MIVSILSILYLINNLNFCVCFGVKIDLPKMSHEYINIFCILVWLIQASFAYDFYHDIPILSIKNKIQIIFHL